MYISVGNGQYSRLKYHKWTNSKFIFALTKFNDDLLGKKGRKYSMYQHHRRCDTGSYSKHSSDSPNKHIRNQFNM